MEIKEFTEEDWDEFKEECPSNAFLKRSSCQRGKKMSAEAKARISATIRGNKRPDEVCTKISAAQRGKKLSDEHRAKIGAAQRGNKQSEEKKLTTAIAMSKAWVYVGELDEIFVSIGAAAKALGEEDSRKLKKRPDVVILEK